MPMTMPPLFLIGPRLQLLPSGRYNVHLIGFHVELQEISVSFLYFQVFCSPVRTSIPSCSASGMNTGRSSGV